MKLALVMSDAAGYSNRVAIYQRIAKAAMVPFVLVSPSDFPQPNSIIASIPEKWISSDLSIKRNRREWARNHLHYLMAIKTSGIEADYYWCVEADVAASPMTWLRLFETTADMDHDGLWTSLSHRAESPNNGWFSNPSTPSDADWYCLGALFRISRRAVDWLLEAAERSREVFTEIHVPSEIANRGGRIRKINRDHHPQLYNCQTMAFTKCVNGVFYPPASSSTKFMHPVKHDAPDPQENLLDIPNQFR